MKPKVFSPWDLLATAGGCALWAFYQRVLPTLPEPFPTHFNAAGRADAWTPKDHLHGIIFGLPLFAWLLLLVIGTLSSRLAKDPAQAQIQAFHPLRGLLGLGFCFLMGSTLLIPSLGLRALQGGVALLLACLITGVALLGRDSARLLKGSPGDANYRWGLFYDNPEDPRLWVEKRIGIGWTLNYARPAAWWLTALFLVPAVAAVAVAFVKSAR